MVLQIKHNRESREAALVKCVDCGFLGARARGDGHWVEADDRFRALGKPPQDIWEAFPACFRRVIEVNKLADEQPGSGRDVKALGVLQADRPCASFTEWRVGYTPREHEELLDRQAANAREDRRDTEARAWQQAMEDKQQKFQEWLPDRARQERRTLVLVAGGFTLLGALLPLIARLFGD